MRCTLLFLTMLSTAAVGQAPGPVREFRVDAGHSRAEFAIGFLGFPVRGRFDDIKGTIAYAGGSPTASSVTVVIGTASINTGSKHRDEHLRSEDFFDVTRYPRIVFRSHAVESEARGLVAVGDLSIRGVTRRIRLPFRAVMPLIEDPHGSSILTFSASIRLARADFGITGGSRHNTWFDAARAASMADSVDVAIEIQAWDTDFGRVTQYDAPLAMIERVGVGQTLAPLRKMRAQHADSLRTSEWELDQIARALLHRGKLTDAIAVLEFNAEAFPRSAGALAALARAHEIAGRTQDARLATQRSLALDPHEPRAMELRRRLGPPVGLP